MGEMGLIAKISIKERRSARTIPLLRINKNRTLAAISNTKSASFWDLLTWKR